ncbi:MAG: hypothetical protein IKC71_03900 [Clostridia bacterium]|nr:hypothetical protein [Clostridia bacterium]
MDNKITKKRLGEMLSYDWLKIIAFCALFVILFEILTSAFSVKLTKGQSFDIVVYPNVRVDGTKDFHSAVLDDKAFSDDVLSFNITNLETTYYAEVLSSIDESSEGDLLIIDNLKSFNKGDTDEKYPTSNMKGAIDKYSIYDFESLILDAKTYLLTFTKDGLDSFTEVENSSFSDCFDESKIEKTFKERMKKDNRFRTEQDYKNGLDAEVKRIEKLFKEVKTFDKIFKEYKDSGLFIKYKKYTVSYEYATLNNSLDKDSWLDKLSKEEELYYGLNLDFFEKNPSLVGKEDKHITNYFSYVDGYFDKTELETTEKTAVDLALLVFDCKKAQPHLQYEVISVINCLIKNCSTLI